MENVKENKMGTMPVFKLLISMALPMVISMLVQSLYNVVDSIYVGQYSKDALTAIGLAWPMQNLLIAFGTGIGVGINAILSKSLGEKNNKKASDTAKNGLFIMLVIFVVFLILGLTILKPYMNALSNNKVVVDNGITYLQIVVCGSLGLILAIYFERLLQSTGKTLFVMFTQGIGAIINIILDPILIYGWWFFPEMGIAGAAVATIAGQFIAAGFGLVFNIFKNHDISLNIKGFRLDGKIIKEVLLIGIPSVVMASIGSILTFLFNKILQTFENIQVPGTDRLYGDDPQTVFGLYFKLNSIFFMPVFGLNNGMVPIIAYNYGARNKQKMMKTMKYAILIAACMMFIGTLAFELIPYQLLSIFAENETVASQLALIGVPCLRIIASSFLIASICIVIMSMFQALGNGFSSMICSIFRQLIILLPVAYMFSKTENLDLVWVSFIIAESLTFVISLLLFARMYKKKIKPLEKSIA